MKLFKFNHSHIAVAKSIAVTTLLLGMLALSGGHWSSAWALPASLPGLPGITATNQATTLPTLGATVNSAHVLHPCARPTAGSPIPQPAQVSSTSNTLDVKLDYYPDDLVDSNGNHQTTFCFLYTDPMGNTSAAPTLHAKAGDTFNVAVTNHVAPLYPLQITDSFGNLIDRLLPLTAFTSSTGQCGAPQQFAEDPSSVNVHFHGFLVTPQCQGDNVARTIINAGQTFQYSFKIPMNEPPGLYWFHPHVHGSGEQAVQGGASGTLIIDGLEQFQPSVAQLPSRVLVLRDQPVATDLAASSGGSVPSWDVSVNYVPVTYRPTVAAPKPRQIYDIPGTITMQAGGTELWRVANASADSI
jgi:FtsP/CotA-like multicopper oxidase with cupredoxin domain